MDGALRLVLSDAWKQREPKEHPTPHEAKLLDTRVATVRVRRRLGVLGADVRLADARGRVVGRRVIGSQVLTGCRGPDTVNLAVREPGGYVLTVRFGDGKRLRFPVDLRAERRVVIDTLRDAPR